MKNNMDMLNQFIQLKETILNIDMDEMKKNIENTGKYFLDKVTDYSGPIFQRVFIDEANSIKIPKCLPAYGKINWFITSSVEDLLYPNGLPYGSYNNKMFVNGVKGSGFIKHIFNINLEKKIIHKICIDV